MGGRNATEADSEKEEVGERQRAISILKNLKGEKNLIKILLEFQLKEGYISHPTMEEIARFLGIKKTKVWSVASFYNTFRFIPPGKRQIKVCLGTACHIKGGKLVMQAWERNLNIKEGEVTEDKEFSLERVGCVGCCVLAPVTVINDKVHGKMTPTKVDGYMLKYKLEKQQNNNKGSR